MPQLLLADGVGMIDLVAEDQEWRLLQLFHAEQRIELGLALGEALWVLGIDEEDDAGDLGEVVLPQAARLLVATEVEGGETTAADAQFFAGGVQRGLEDGDAVVLQHV